MPIPPSHAAALAPTPARLYALALEQSEKEFAASNPYHFLVPLFGAATAVDPAEAPAQWGEAASEITDVVVDSTEMSLGKQLFAVRKVQPLYEAMITVGRTANHDVVLRDPSVSKFHAFFKVTPSGLYLVDADSTRGTTIDGKPLVKREATLALVGAVIGFGSVRLRLLTAALSHQAVHLAR